MRLKNATRNMTAMLFSEVIRLTLGIIVPRMIILKFGSTVNGFTVTVTNILNVFNLIQAGAVGASIYEMYTPVSQGDYKKVSNILYTSRRYFCKLGIAFILIVLAISPVVSISQTNNEISFWEMELSIILLGINGLFSFCFFSWYDILFCSHQKRYIISLASTAYYICYYVLVFITLAIPFSHFIWMYIAAICGNVVKLFVLYIVYQKHYKALLPKADVDKKYLIKNRYHLLVQQVTVNVMEFMVPIILSYIGKYRIVSVYAIYHMVFNIFSMLMFQLLNSIVNIVAHVVRTENDDRILQICDLIHFVIVALGTWMGGCLACLLLPFVRLYTNGITDVNYVRPEFVFVIIIYSMAITAYIPIYLVANAYGFYKKITVFYVVGMVVAIIIALMGGRDEELMVILMPSILYIIIVIGIYAVCVRNLQWFSRIKIFKRSICMLLFVLAAWLLGKNSFYICNMWKEWLIKSSITAIIFAVVILVYALIFERPRVRSLCGYARAIMKKG